LVLPSCHRSPRGAPCLRTRCTRSRHLFRCRGSGRTVQALSRSLADWLAWARQAATQGDRTGTESDLWLKQAAFAKTNELAARAAVKPRRRAAAQAQASEIMTTARGEAPSRAHRGGGTAAGESTSFLVSLFLAWGLSQRCELSHKRRFLFHARSRLSERDRTCGSHNC
jgi:hypothetical protein